MVEKSSKCFSARQLSLLPGMYVFLQWDVHVALLGYLCGFGRVSNPTIFEDGLKITEGRLEGRRIHGKQLVYSRYDRVEGNEGKLLCLAGGEGKDVPGDGSADSKEDEANPPEVDKEEAGQEDGRPHDGEGDNFRTQGDGFVYHIGFDVGTEIAVSHDTVV